MLPKLEQIKIVTAADMSALSTYRIGGRVDYLATAGSAPDELAELLSWAKKQELPWAVIGNGSNILMPDEDTRALLIRLDSHKELISVKNNEICVGAGVNNCDLSQAAAGAGLTGFSFLYDIPGTIGGAVMQNAGMNDESFSQLVKTVTHLAPDGAVYCTKTKDLAFGYRHSIFKDKWHDHIILQATLTAKGSAKPEDIQEEMEATKKLRWSKFPMEYGNCGSVFKRPEGYFAGKLIQDAGLSGFTIGGAQVSPKHRNFLVNYQNASAKDVKRLINHVQNVVFDQSGVRLERELLFLEEILQIRG